jgi:outer membrane protein
MIARALLALALLPMGQAWAQDQLTLAAAEETALRNHPRIASAERAAEMARAGVTEARAPLAPQISGNFTSVGAEHSSTVAAGAIQTSSLYSRMAAGVAVSQLVTDFGRTAYLTRAAALRADSQAQTAGNTKAEIRLQVDEAYYRSLGADEVLRVAQAVLENRRLMLRQVQALARSSLKSTLDVSFAEVAVSDAELAQVRAENDAKAERALLAEAMGAPISEVATLADEPMSRDLEVTADEAVAEAIRSRQDLAALRLNREAADSTARAEAALSRPTISLLGVAGDLPETDPRLHGTYSAAGVNVSIPVWNGWLFAARQTQAALRARIANKDAEALALRIAGQVRVAWLEADTALRRIDVTARLVDQAEQSLRLARTRYENGLGSIVELNQAQLSQVTAAMAAAGAKYEYLGRRAELAYAMGVLR